MSDEDAAYVRVEQARQAAHEEQLDAAYQLARAKLGEGVSRVPGGLRFQLNREDDRWVRLYGAEQWSAIAARPDANAQVTVSFIWEWSDECRDIYRFYACLSDRSFCKEGSATEKSAIRIERVDSGRRKWGLALKPTTLEQAATRDRIKSFLTTGLERLRNQLENELPEAYDDAVLVIFVEHVRWMKSFQPSIIK